jgi:hypothetical protein
MTVLANIGRSAKTTIDPKQTNQERHVLLKLADFFRADQQRKTASMVSKTIAK